MRIAFTGPESSGKTTFSKWLSSELSESLYVPEFAREYLEERKIISASANDFTAIVREQCSLFNEAPISKYQIFDTDIFVLRIWNEEVYQLKLPELEILPTYKMDIHFLCAPDVEWEEDVLRTNRFNRWELFHLFRNALEQASVKYEVLRGTPQQKRASILAHISRLQ
jgi:nicotinamide riboside kinase